MTFIEYKQIPQAKEIKKMTFIYYISSFFVFPFRTI